LPLQVDFMVIYYQFSDPIGVRNLRSCQLPGAAKLSIHRNALTTGPGPTA
jgi:hypothetical protein